MKSFTDNNGRTWCLTVNVATIKRVRAIAGIDLNAIVEMGEDGKPDISLLQRLSSDPVLLVDTLYAVCKPECDARNITDEDFGSAMAGDAIDAATSALLDEIVDFFPAAKRMAFKKILTASRRFADVAKSKLEKTMQAPGFEDRLVSELERLTGLSDAVQESAE